MSTCCESSNTAMCRARAEVTVPVVMSVVVVNELVPGSKNSAFTVGVVRLAAVYPPASRTFPPLIGALSGIFTAVWKARGKFMALVDVQIPVTSQTTAVADGVPAADAPPTMSTLPLSNAVTVTPCRASALFWFRRNHDPGAIVAVAVAVAVAPARLVSGSVETGWNGRGGTVALAAPRARALRLTV